MATTAKRQEQIDKVKKIMHGNTPVLSEDTYQVDLLHALNYYNYHNDDKEKKKWLLQYVDKKLATQLNKLDENLFRHAGVLAKLIADGSVLQEKEQSFLDRKITELKNALPKPEIQAEGKPATNVISIQDRMAEKAQEIAGEFEGYIDEFVLNDKMFEAKDVLKAYQVSGPVAKLVAPRFNNTIAELEELLEGNDEQLNEGYSHLKKPKIKKLLALYKSIGEACGNQVQVAKATRAPRKRKEKPAGVVVSKLKFKMSDDDYGVKSISAPSIVNSKELWVFNTKYKKLQVYRAPADTKGLTVKGTTVIGWDPENSGGRTLRKPELVKSYADMGKRPLNAAYKALTTKEATVNGRINEECILLRVFS